MKMEEKSSIKFEWKSTCASDACDAMEPCLADERRHDTQWEMQRSRMRWPQYENKHD